jgi:hypothetical protein
VEADKKGDGALRAHLGMHGAETGQLYAKARAMQDSCWKNCSAS